MNKETGECFTTWHFNDGVHGFELLAKRPEPEWVPEVGDWCKCTYPIKWTKVYYVGKGSSGGHVIQLLSGECPVVGSLVKFRPIKTQREELIDMLCANNGKTAEVMADAILARFDLTEKDGE